MGLLMMLGLIVMYAIGPQRANVLNAAYGTDFYTANYFVIKQVISLLLAIAAFVVMALLPFSILKKWGWRLVQLSFVLCALLFLFGNILHIDQIATNTLGAYRWFNLGPLGSFQPSEALKMSLIVYLAAFLGKRFSEGKINDASTTIYPMVALVAGALLVVVVLQKDMGTGIALGSAVLAMCIVAAIKWKTLGKIALVGVVAATLLIVTSPHRVERVTTFFGGSDDSAHDMNNGYHIKNAMIALGTGGMMGRGIGQSVQATGYLPEAINDSIFAIMGEIFGFVGTTVIIGLFAALLMRLLKIADHLPDMSMRLVVAGVFGWLAAHVVMNIGSMIGLVPLTGITLPLLSFGGTSMVFMTAALGLVFQLSRYTAHQAISVKEGGDEDSRRGRGVRRTRYASARRYQSAR